MQKTVKVGGRQVKIRGIKWKEKLSLKADGYDLTNIDLKANNDALVERVVDMAVLNRSVLDDLEILDVYSVFFQIVRLSFTGEVASKNSKRRPPSPPKASSGTAGNAKERV